MVGVAQSRPRRAQLEPPHQARESGPLKLVTGRMPLREYLVQLYERRHFISMQSWSQSTQQGRGMMLGNLWLILSPLLDGFVYFLIFGMLFSAGRSVPNFFGYIIIGVFMFGFSTRCVTGGTGSIVNNTALIRSFRFPRAALPIAVVLREVYSSLPVLVVMLVLLLAVPPKAPLTVYWALFPLVFGLHTLFNLGLALIVARVGSWLPDFRKIVPIFMRLWMYSSAVIFTIERFRNYPAIARIIEQQPLYRILLMYREIFLDGTMPGPAAWFTLVAWALGALIVGGLFFWQGEASYGRR